MQHSISLRDFGVPNEQGTMFIVSEVKKKIYLTIIPAVCSDWHS